MIGMIRSLERRADEGIRMRLVKAIVDPALQEEAESIAGKGVRYEKRQTTAESVQ